MGAPMEGPKAEIRYPRRRPAQHVAGGRATALAAAALTAAACANAPPPGAAGPALAPVCVHGLGGFGRAVALSEDGAALAVGSPYDSGAAAGALHPEDPGFREATADVRVRAMGKEGDGPGPAPPEGVRHAGAVRVFRAAGGGRWALEANIKPGEPEPWGLFGGELAMDAAGDTLAVGPGGQTNSSRGPPEPRGAAVYRRSAEGRWALEAAIAPPAPPDGQRAAGAAVPGPRELDPSGWRTPDGDRFGWSVALSAGGSALALGAPWRRVGNAGGSYRWGPPEADDWGSEGGAGAVFVYRRSASGRWALEGRVAAGDPGDGDGFGSSVALDAAGALLAAGAPGKDGGDAGVRHGEGPGPARPALAAAAADSGAAYLYRRGPSGRWAPEARVKAPSPRRGAAFGARVALDAAGRTLAVAAASEPGAASGVFHPGDPGTGRALAGDARPGAGAVHVYRRGPSGRWAPEAHVKAPPRQAAGEGLGFFLALSADGAALAAGTRFDDVGSEGFSPGPPGPCAGRPGVGRAPSVALGLPPFPDAVRVYRRSAAGRWALAARASVHCPTLYDNGSGGVALSSGGLLASGREITDEGRRRGAVCVLRAGGAAPAAAPEPPEPPPRQPWPRGVSAYLKVPAVRASPWLDDREGGMFGAALALAGDTLAVLAADRVPATGAFHPGAAGLERTLAGEGGRRGVAAHVYRRSAAGRWALEAYVKAPGTAAVDWEPWFGSSVALSADGAALAIGDPSDDSPATGVFHPGDGGLAGALASTGARSGAAHIYRRGPSGHWAPEAYVKAPKPAGGGWGSRFGSSVALSADGAALAASAPWDAGVAGVARGAAYVYRRGPSGRWAPEARVKAPRPAVGRFGPDIALSADGAALVVLADGATSVRLDGVCPPAALAAYSNSAAGVFHPGDGGLAGALVAPAGTEGSRGAYVYRRSASGRWALEVYVKAPKAPVPTGCLDWFGRDAALSADGAALAVTGADGSSATGVFHPGDGGLAGALASTTDAKRSGAAYVYRRGPSGRWALEAYAKAPGSAGNSFDGVALSADGAALAIGDPWDVSPAVGAFRRGDAGFGKAPSASGGVEGSGAALVYRRSAAGRWALDAYVKAPAPYSGGGGGYPGDEDFPGASLGDRFGHGVALSADGAVLAVGAPYEDGSASGALHPGDPGFRDALSADGADDSGAVFLYELPARPAD